MRFFFLYNHSHINRKRTMKYAALFVVLLCCCAGPPQDSAKRSHTPWPNFGDFDRQGAISQFYADRDLDPVEGVWIYADRRFELAIVGVEGQDNEFVGFVLSSTDRSWRSGDERFRITKAGKRYALSYYTVTHRKSRGSALSLNGSELHFEEVDPPMHPDAEPVTLVRVYPQP